MNHKHMLNFLGKKEIFEKQLAFQKINNSFNKIVSVNATRKDHVVCSPRFTAHLDDTKITRWYRPQPNMCRYTFR